MSDDLSYISYGEVARHLSNAALLGAIREGRNDGIYHLETLKAEAKERGLDPDGKDDPEPPLAATA